jgi:hypothetical protein
VALGSNHVFHAPFERPICVGVRGVIVKVDIKNPVRLDPGSSVEWLEVSVGD